MTRTPCRLFLVGLAALSSAACTTLPKPAEMLTAGYRSPEQTFHTFQLAVRADLSTLEYKCFSTRFRAENHLSLMAWREVREQLWGKIGMRWAVATAKATGPVHLYGNVAEFEVAALGKHMHLRFVREGFGELYSGEQLIADDTLDFQANTGTQQGRWFYGQVEMPADCESAKLTELRVGREWKLDQIDPVSTTP